ncbi:YCF48-related protein [Pseudomonas sp. P5_109]|uniref:WD40/YVTN/BNR-like repeat-containing protein n=1 Tax=Pseudomonas sp. P5_109 TaxID=3043441 RepID=UPI002A365D89|nr:YCF48-related protein [Pseudomonas sp. P5_109]WPN27375.1 YCF48-related protein [Pseudomonas sp. P5_109]
MTLKFPLRPAFALLLGLGGALTAQAAMLNDRLERASQPTALATDALLSDVQAVGDRQVMVGAAGHILLRDNSGRVQQAKVPVDLLLTAVQFVDAHNGWAVGHDGVVLHSADGGQSWSKQLDGRAVNPLLLKAAQAQVDHAEQAASAAPDDEQLATALDNARFALDDAQAASASGPSRPLLGLWFRNAREGWVVGAYGIFLKTDDGGASWRAVNGLDNPDRLHLNSVLGLADGSLLVAGEGGRLYRSADGGEHWQPTQQPTDASLYALAELSGGQIMASGFGGTLLVSNDHGASWTARRLPVKASLYGIKQLSSGAVVLAGQAGVLLYSADGKTFEEWRAPDKAALLNVSETRAGQLLLVGNAGLQVLPMIPFKEHAQ